MRHQTKYRAWYGYVLCTFTRVGILQLTDWKKVKKLSLSDIKRKKRNEHLLFN